MKDSGMYVKQIRAMRQIRTMRTGRCRRPTSAYFG